MQIITKLEDELAEARLIEADCLEWAIAAHNSRISDATRAVCDRNYSEAKIRRESLEQSLTIIRSAVADGAKVGAT